MKPGAGGPSWPTRMSRAGTAASGGPGSSLLEGRCLVEKLSCSRVPVDRPANPPPRGVHSLCGWPTEAAAEMPLKTLPSGNIQTL